MFQIFSSRIFSVPLELILLDGWISAPKIWLFQSLTQWHRSLRMFFSILSHRKHVKYKILSYFSDGFGHKWILQSSQSSQLCTRGSKSRYHSRKWKDKEGTHTPHSIVRVRCSAAAARTPQGPCPVLGPRSVHYSHRYIEYPTIATEGLHRFLSAWHWAELRMHQIPDILSSWTFRHVRRPRTVLNHSNSHTECLESIWDTSGCTSGVVGRLTICFP